MGDGLQAQACSYNRGGRDVGIKGSWPSIDALIKCMAMAKSLKSREPRFFVSARVLPRYQMWQTKETIVLPYPTDGLGMKPGLRKNVTSWRLYLKYCQYNANIKVLCHLPARRLFRGPWRWKMSIYFAISCGVGGVKTDINWSSVASGSTLIRPSILPDSGRT